MQPNFPTPQKIFHFWGTFSHELLRAQNRHFLSIDPFANVNGMHPGSAPVKYTCAQWGMNCLRLVSNPIQLMFAYYFPPNAPLSSPWDMESLESIDVMLPQTSKCYINKTAFEILEKNYLLFQYPYFFPSTCSLVSEVWVGILQVLFNKDNFLILFPIFTKKCNHTSSN